VCGNGNDESIRSMEGRSKHREQKVSLLGYAALLKIHALLYRGTYATNPMDTRAAPQASKQVTSSKHERRN